MGAIGVGGDLQGRFARKIGNAAVDLQLLCDNLESVYAGDQHVEIQNASTSVRAHHRVAGFLSVGTAQV